MTEEEIDGQVQKIAESLDRLLRLSGRTRRELEEELGLGSAGVSKILKGTVRLQMSHVFLLTQALGVDPGQFFRWALPPQGTLSPLLAKALGQTKDDGAALVDDDELERRMKRILARLLGLPT